jgi:hypothetical protein
MEVDALTAEQNLVKRGLTQLEAVLVAYSLHFHAGFVRDLIHWYEQEPERFRQEVLSNDLWGGAGSISDLSLTGFRPSDERAREDQRRLRSAIIHLAEGLEAEGLADERALGVAATFRRWNEKGL